MGEPARTDGFELVVRRLETSKGIGIVKPDPGTSFVVVDVEVRNRSGAPATLSSLVQMSLLSDEGMEMDRGFYFPEPRFPEGSVPAGGTASGKVSFQAPEKEKRFLFVFDPGLPGQKAVYIRLD